MKLLILKFVCIILIILTLFASATGCDFVTSIINKDNKSDANAATDEANKNSTDTNQKTGLESGFIVSSGDESPSITCALKSDKTEFDIDDVTLDFYYGILFTGSEEYAREYGGHNIPSFDICFENIKGDRLILIRHVEENLVSEKYRTVWVYDENYSATFTIYNHSETLTIPKELFTPEEDVILFSIYGTDVNSYDPVYKGIAYKYIYYKIDGDKVIIYPGYPYVS